MKRSPQNNRISFGPFSQRRVGMSFGPLSSISPTLYILGPRFLTGHNLEPPTLLLSFSKWHTPHPYFWVLTHLTSFFDHMTHIPRRPHMLKKSSFLPLPPSLNGQIPTVKIFSFHIVICYFWLSLSSPFLSRFFLVSGWVGTLCFLLVHLSCWKPLLIQRGRIKTEKKEPHIHTTIGNFWGLVVAKLKH